MPRGVRRSGPHRAPQRGVRRRPPLAARGAYLTAPARREGWTADAEHLRGAHLTARPRGRAARVAPHGQYCTRITYAPPLPSDHLHDVKVVHYCPTRYTQARVLDRSVGSCADRRAEGVHGEYEAHARDLDARPHAPALRTRSGGRSSPASPPTRASAGSSSAPLPKRARTCGCCSARRWRQRRPASGATPARPWRRRRSHADGCHCRRGKDA